MAFWNSLWNRKQGSASHLLVPHSEIRLATTYCDPFYCAPYRTGFDPKAVGGATLSSGVPVPLDRNRWKRVVTVPVEKRHILTAVAWDDASGDGSITYNSQPPRRRRSLRYMAQAAKKEVFKTDDEHRLGQTEYLSTDDYSMHSSVADLPRLSRGARPYRTRTPTFSRSNLTQKRAKPAHIFRMDLKRDHGHETFSFHREETKLGKLNFTFAPKKRFSGSVVVKDALVEKLLRSRAARKRLRYKRRKSQIRPANTSFKSDFEYKWKDKSVAISGAIETYNATLSLRSRLNPIRLNSRIQIPLTFRPDSAWVCWAHDHGSGWGEFLVGRRGLELSADVHNSKVGLKKRNPNGSLTRISVGKGGAVVLDKTLTIGPFIAGSIATVSAHLTTQKTDNSLNASFVMPFGVASISANTARSLNAVMDFNFKKERRLYAFAFKLDPKFAAVRMAVCF